MTVAAHRTGSAQDILRLGSAYCEAQALLTAVELDLFTALDGIRATAGQIAATLGLPGRGVRDFLSLLVALGLLDEQGGRYRNSDAAGRHLVAGRPGYVGGSLLGSKINLYPLWNELTGTLRTGRPRTAPGDFADMLADPGELRRYADMMAGTLRPLLPGLLAGVDWAAYGSVLDVGGCAGELTGRLVQEWPALTGLVFDLPRLRPVFQECMARLGAGDRVAFHPGDFFHDPLPRADVVVLGHVLHNWSASRRELLMRKAFDAVTPGGVAVVHDRMLTGAPGDVDNVVASLIMTLVTDEGEEYTVAELTGLAREVGFDPAPPRPLGDNETLLLCHRP